MSTITTRAGKGSPLTNSEVDANFTNLNTDKAELSGAAFTGAITTNSTIDGRDVATDGTKLDGIEASADVTDTTNVTAAGALMDSELTSIASVKALNQGVATTDSPTFAALTVTGEITANGGIALGDSDKATFGASDDLQIYHDGSHSYISDTGAGYLRILASDYLQLMSSSSEVYLNAGANGGVTLYHDNFEKIATTSTGIDVTGTATMDGLTVDGVSNLNGVAQIGGSTDLLYLSGKTGTHAYMSLGASNTAADFFIGADTAIPLLFRTNATQRMQVASNGDISFYEDTGTTAKLFWDASAERLGIGTSNPQETLHLFNSSTNWNQYSNIRMSTESDSYAAEIGFHRGTSSDNDRGLFLSGDGSTKHVRVLHDGNVGIGTSSTSGLKTVIKGETGYPTTSGTTQTGVLRLSGGTGLYNVLDMGVNESTDTAWIQATRANSLGTYDKLLLNPYGGNVGIGTSSPTSYNSKADDLVVATSGDTGLSIISGTSNEGAIAFGDGTGGGSPIMGRVRYDHSTNSMDFRVNNDQAMLIDSSGNVNVLTGNLLVGTSDTFPGGGDTNTGVSLTSTGAVVASRDGDFAARFNRKTSDGEIIGLNKDGLTVGSIGVNAGSIAFGQSNTGIGAFNTDRILFPATASGVVQNAQIDLGYANGRFKDLYLSGNVNAERVFTVHDGDWGMEMKGVTSARLRLHTSAGGSGEVGSITVTTSSTSYNTSSDYRLKEDWQPVENATDRLKELKPCNFAWKVDGSRVDGFLAHELQEVVPEAVTGEKDAMQTEEYEVTPAVTDEEGNVTTEAVMGEREVPDYQGIDQSKLVPLLVATIQELEARISQLENN